MSATHAHFEGETDEQTADHVAALKVELAGQKDRGENANDEADKVRGKRRAGEIQAELDRIQGTRSGKQTRAAGGDA